MPASLMGPQDEELKFSGRGKLMMPLMMIMLFTHLCASDFVSQYFGPVYSLEALKLELVELRLLIHGTLLHRRTMNG